MEALKVDFTRNPKQASFVTNTNRYSCYSGGYGSGKTVAGCVRSFVLSTMFPKNVGLIGRLTYPELRDTTRKQFFEICPPDWYAESGGGKFLPTENYLRLVNGSEILFRHLDTVSEKELLSLNLGWFYIDQAEEISESVFMTLQSRLRLNRVPNRYGFLTCNPEYGNWIYNRFQKPMEEGKPRPDHYIINSSTLDNPFNPKDYIESMMSDWPEEVRRKYVEGRWDAIQNQIYTEFSHNIHVVKPFSTPKSWEYLIGVDYGMVNPTCALLATIDYDGNIFIIDEYYSPGVISEHSKAIHRMTEPYEISMWLIDPSTQRKSLERKDGYGSSMPWSVIEEFEDNHLYFIPANNEKIAGINRVKEFLLPVKNRRHPVHGTFPAPKLYIFQNCINLITELVQYKWKQLKSATARNKIEDSVDYADHACFVGDTDILVKGGVKKIKDVKVGDFVATPFGWSRVLEAGLVGKKIVKNYGAFISTLDHPILTTKGVFSIDSLRYDDIILLWSEWKKLIGKEQIIEDTRMQNNGLIELIINALLPRSLASKQDIYTEKYGNFIMVKFQKIWKLITLIATLPIMIFQIWKYFLRANIRESIRGNLLMVIWNTLKTLGYLLKNGTQVKREKNGINNMPFKFLKRGRKSKKTVLYAINDIPHTFLAEANTVIRTAKQKPFVTEVYNLKTEHGVYFANGVLVSNCDALRYIIMSRFPSPSKRASGFEFIPPSQRKNKNSMVAPMENQGTPDDELGSFYSSLSQPLSVGDEI